MSVGSGNLGAQGREARRDGGRGFARLGGNRSERSGFYGIERRNVSELELVIAGAGAAGLSAALYASLLHINYLLFDAEAGGGLMNLAKQVENLPGVSGLRGPAISERLLKQLVAAGGSLRAHEAVVVIEPPSAGGGLLTVRTTRGRFRPKTVIIATGLELLGLEQEFGIPDERRFLGKGLSYCAECDGPLFRGKRVLVAGNPFDAFLLKRLAREVLYLGPVPAEYRAQVPRQIIEANDIPYREGALTALEGKSRLEAVVVDGERIPIDGLFLTKRKAGAEVYARAGVDLDDQGFIRVDRHLATSVAGIYACGDITGEPWQIAKSIGEGAIAALSVFKYLTGQEMRNLGWALRDEWEP